ncbi:MAG TPA: hypothetical protein VNY51_02570 [Candidatus Dormibacteraeota bacterium]|jgi:hypothetical protein|nr:hypothetical protein [Candidatus Dormibacteraeota bacterium]
MMRTMLISLLSILALTPLLNAQDEGAGDPYSLSIVRFELKMNSGGRRVVHSWSQKRLTQLGDGVSVALLKILSPKDLKDPERLSEYLSLIRSSFASPDTVSIEANKSPQVTLFLLGWLRQNVTGSASQALIEQTEEFVRLQTAHIAKGDQGSTSR